MRTTIDIPKQILDEIDTLAKREKISRAEAIRRGIAEYLEKRSRLKPNAAFGIWKSRSIDPVEYEDALRREWVR
jgi:metal-responsive CopG/Arc/MetJ family transcriptional regulator